MGSTERARPDGMTKEQLQAAHPRCQKGLIPLLEKPRVFVLSRVITQFYRKSFISKELEMLLYQNVNYQRHSHHRVETCLLSRSSCPGHTSQFRTRVRQQDGQPVAPCRRAWHLGFSAHSFLRRPSPVCVSTSSPFTSDFTWQLLPSPTLRHRLQAWPQKGAGELTDT